MRIQADRTVGYGPGGGPRSEPLCRREGRADRLSGRRPPGDGPLRAREVRRAHAANPGSRATSDGPTRTAGSPKPRRSSSARRRACSKRPSRVHFTQGPTSLTAPSARYDIAERVMRFAGPVEASGTGADSGGLSRMTAREGLYRRDSGVGGARVRHGRVALGGPRRGRPSRAADGGRGRPPLLGAPHRQRPGRPGRRRASSRSGGLGRPPAHGSGRAAAARAAVLGRRRHGDVRRRGARPNPSRSTARPRCSPRPSAA